MSATFVPVDSSTILTEILADFKAVTGRDLLPAQPEYLFCSAVTETKAAKWGLDICGFAVVDIVNNTALHLNAWQTPSADELTKKGLTLLTHYASLVNEHAKTFKEFSTYNGGRCLFLEKTCCRYYSRIWFALH
jgi:hypothetical protein